MVHVAGSCSRLGIRLVWQRGALALAALLLVPAANTGPPPARGLQTTGPEKLTLPPPPSAGSDTHFELALGRWIRTRVRCMLVDDGCDLHLFTMFSSLCFANNSGTSTMYCNLVVSSGLPLLWLKASCLVV